MEDLIIEAGEPVRPWYVVAGAILGSLVVFCGVAAWAFGSRFGMLQRYTAYVNGDRKLAAHVANGALDSMVSRMVLIVFLLAGAFAVVWLTRRVWAGIVAGALAYVPYAAIDVAVSAKVHANALMMQAVGNQMQPTGYYLSEAAKDAVLAAAIGVGLGYLWLRYDRDHREREASKVLVSRRYEEQQRQRAEEAAELEARAAAAAAAREQTQAVAAGGGTAASDWSAPVTVVPQPVPPAPAPVPAVPQPAASPVPQLTQATERIAVRCKRCGASNIPTNRTCIACGRALA